MHDTSEGRERPPSAAAVEFGGASPILRVRDLEASVAYYVDALGFALDWRYPGSIASVTRGGCTLFLSQGDQGTPGSWAWIGVSDAEALHEELRARGARIRQGPTNFAWALELQVEDPDGNVLRLGSGPKADAPIGPWLDMNGVRWVATAEGGWRAETAEPGEAETDKAETGTAETGTAETGTAEGAPSGAGDRSAVSGSAASDSAVSDSASPGSAVSDSASPGSAVSGSAVSALKELAEQARRAGDHATARRLYEEAVALQRPLGDPLALAHTVRHLGDVHREARRPHLAEPLYAEALATYRAHAGAQPLNHANTLRSMAVLKQETGDVVAARRLWEEAARLYQELDVREGVAESAGWAARLAWRAGDLSRAREWLAAARVASDASNDPATWRFVREVGLELGG